jgi:fructokinase
MTDFPLFVAAGEALTDLIVDMSVADGSATRWNSQVGGSTWNVARAMARLGVPTGFAGAISRDVFGDQLWQASQEAGLDLRLLLRVDKSPLLAIVHRLDPPSYFFVGDDSADLHFDAAALPEGWRSACRWAHFGGISLARRPLADKLVALAESLKSDGVRISYDPNFRAIMDESYDATLRRMTELADVVKVSEEDLAGLFRSDDTDKALATLRSWNPQAGILYTKGGAGAAFYSGANSGNKAWQVAAPRVEVVDTVGAGDASMAALAWSMLQSPERDGLAHLRFAVAAGAAACLALGATPPSLEQIDALLVRMDAGTLLSSSMTSST